jgi:glucans biosynthesis protein
MACSNAGLTLIIVCALLVLSPSQVWCAPKRDKKFSFESVVDKAKELARQSFQQPAGQLPDFLLKIDYDAWRDIRFKPDQALWLKEKMPFTVQFFHPGFYYDRTVKINVVSPAGIDPVAFSPDLFNYGKNDFKDKIPKDVGFAGFRLHYPINTKAYLDEVAVFLGASYLRAVAKKQQYGISARGLALDTALGTGEEFPYFREFWLVKPAPGATQITVYALLDSPSLTGAYRFIIKPGKETEFDVKATLFKRRQVAKIGIAPLTSMFFYGENTNQRPNDDFRPEVHDSDGLMIAFRSGEWLWRPLQNPTTLMINAFIAPDPVGFGIVQRDLDFDHYQDLEANYELRPSVWITAKNKWGKGRIELIQIPTENELNNNITAFWVPEETAGTGEPMTFSYLMSWYFPDGNRPPGGRVIATRTAQGREERIKKFIIDFKGEQLDALPADKPLTAIISVDERTRVLEQQLYKNRITKGWRLVFQIVLEEQAPMDRVLPNKRMPLELRAFLKDGESVLTETWSYPFLP